MLDRHRPNRRDVAAFALLLAAAGCSTGSAGTPSSVEPISPRESISGLPGADVERRPVKIINAFHEADGTTLQVGVESCNGDPTVSTEETTEAVTVRVTSAVVVEGDRFDCQDVVSITLDAPLADRRLMDGNFGAEVAVEGR